jgi:hypothetical protein
MKVTNKVSKTEMIRQTITFIKINPLSEYHGNDNPADTALGVDPVDQNQSTEYRLESHQLS